MHKKFDCGISGLESHGVTAFTSFALFFEVASPGLFSLSLYNFGPLVCAVAVAEERLLRRAGSYTSFSQNIREVHT